MTTLEEKLQDILKKLGSAYYFEGGEIDKEEYQNYIKEILEAIKSEGYSKAPVVVYDKESKTFEDYCTGQEWYDKFMGTLRLAIPTDPNEIIEWVREVARKASGLED